MRNISISSNFNIDNSATNIASNSGSSCSLPEIPLGWETSDYKIPLLSCTQ
jgi:hypothetical protein